VSITLGLSYGRSWRRVNLVLLPGSLLVQNVCNTMLKKSKNSHPKSKFWKFLRNYYREQNNFPPPTIPNIWLLNNLNSFHVMFCWDRRFGSSDLVSKCGKHRTHFESYYMSGELIYKIVGRVVFLMTP
jgi:hypothetical protein